MQIIITTDYISRGGKERQISILTKYLLDKGYKIVVFTINYNKNNYLNEYNIPQEVIYYCHKKSKKEIFLSLKKLASKYNKPIVCSFDSLTSFYCLILHKLKKIIFINFSIRHGIRLFNKDQLIRSIILWFSPYVVANSKAGLKANNLKSGKKRFVLYNAYALNKDTFSVSVNNLGQIHILREKINKNIPLDRIIFISIANFNPYKDYTTVFKALSLIKEKFNFFYIILGDGPLRDKIESEILLYQLENHVHLAGNVENVHDYLKISDVMIHSSRGEGISNAILEAMFAGLPIIASNVGGVPETIFPPYSLLFPYKDYKALYNCLLKAKELKSRFNPNNPDYLNHLKKFSVEEMINQFEKIISEVLRRNK